MSPRTPLWKAQTGALAYAAPLLVAALVRAALCWDAANAPLLGDEAGLVRDAKSWAEHGLYAGIWPPAYPALLRITTSLFGDAGVLAARVFNALCSCLVVALTMGVAHRVGGRRTAVLAGWFTALHLSMAIWAGLLYTEALFVALTLAAVWSALYTTSFARPPTGSLVVTGVLLGLASTVRAVGAPIVFVVCSALLIDRLQRLWQRRRSAAAQDAEPGSGSASGPGAWVDAGLAFAVPLAAAAIVMLPMAIQQTSAVGASSWISFTGPVNMAVGWSGTPVPFDRARLDEASITASPLGPLRAWAELPGPERPPDHVLSNEVPFREWVPGRIKSSLREHPGWVLRSRLTSLSDLFSPVSFFHRSQRLGQLDTLEVHSIMRRATAIWCAGFGAVLAALALIGIGRARYSNGWWWLSAGFFALHVAIPLAMFGVSRFRAPLEPFIVIFASLAFVAKSDAHGARPARSLMPAIVIALSYLLALPIVIASIRAVW